MSTTTTRPAYTMRRNMRGELQALAVIPLGFDRRELHITTDKATRGISCDAAVYRITPDGLGREHAFDIGGRGGGDFRRTLASNPAGRATEKALRTMHEAATSPELVAALLADVRKHYRVAELAPAAVAAMDETAGATA